MRSVAIFLSLAASAFAYQVTSPTNSTGWTTTGPNVVSWTRVDSDPQNFTIQLSNQQSFPPKTETLIALVDGTKSTSVTVSPPSGGWVAGPGYQVNLVSADNTNSGILAQSGQFTITAGSGSTFSSGSSSSGSTTSGSPTSNTLTVTNTGAAQNTGSSGGSTPTDASVSSLNPTAAPTNAASPTLNMQAGVFAVLALLSSFLA
ncbi:hypothetical protein EUX98_g2864 [Antrodiella citrinella]|uniref:Yeast cell wall synthesis Kre9/Knh1-like N-terminal domain-containing protein n=1 Tax=Antrodiella citrinella TaxID=2447956 RepID=A0A4S4N0R7_9APHY|nr:hypothetical protein EUX98_g2864 [Antrodiella citrinella]